MRVVTTLGDGIAALRIVERGEPVPGPGEVVIRMVAASLNYRDLLVVGGKGHWKPSVPRVPLSDGVGIVTAVGESVTRVAVGDRVAPTFLPNWLSGPLTAEKGAVALGGAATDGVLAEFCLFAEDAVVRVPEFLSHTEAATLPVAALTAWHAVRHRSRIDAGDHVLIQGTGGVSLAALQFANTLGAATTVISSSDEKLERVTALGASATINYRQRPDWEEHVLAMTGGRGVDHVVEVVGGSNLNRSLRALRVGGTISFIGSLAGLAGSVDTFQFVNRNVNLFGIETGSRAMFEEMNGFIAAHAIHPVVDRVLDFTKVGEAMQYLDGRSHFGKVAITF